MFLPTGLPTRRKFLERSVLGAGSILFLPGLLGSCTDHNIPGPDTPIIIPTLTDTDIDWNEKAKIVVVHGLELIPEVGEILGPLAEIFWPSSKEDVWGQVRAQVEAIVDQKIAEDKYNTVSGYLQGLNNSVTYYLNEVKNGNPVSILDQWISTRNSFAVALPSFQAPGYQLPLLGLFAQFANMYLAVLRDGVKFGKSWGRSETDQGQDKTDLENAIQDFTKYTNDTYNLRKAILLLTSRDDHKCEPFRTLNAYERQMTLSVLDYMTTWQYYNVTLYPNGAKNPDGTPINILTREIYSDPYGTCDDSGPIVLPSPPTQRPTNLTVWGGDRVNAVQLTYPQGSGPDGVTQTERMGTSSSGSNQPPRGGSFNLSSNNPIIQAKATYGDIVNSLQFGFNDGTTTNIVGGGYVDSNHKPNDSGWIGYPHEALSSVHINGLSYFYDSADCVVFGFQYWTPPAATLNALRAIYVISPKERSVADFAKAFPKLAIPADLITEDLKASRKAYWAYVEARAKALK